MTRRKTKEEIKNDFIKQQLEQVGIWLQESEYILVVGGAGMSAAAGLDFTDASLFASMFPFMSEVGFRNMYHLISYNARLCPDNKTQWIPTMKWGYMAEQAKRARFTWRKHSVYQKLLKIVESKEPEKCFVITSNADGMFAQNGFNSDRIYNLQGDYSVMQCLTPCREDAHWPSKPAIDKIMPTIVKPTQYCGATVVPKCPHCSGPVHYNVRSGEWFIEDVANHLDAYTSWLYTARGRRLGILEIGVGFSTPSVLRWPMEKLALSNAYDSRFIRINRGNSGIPDKLQKEKPGQSIGVAVDAAKALDIISPSYFTKLTEWEKLEMIRKEREEREKNERTKMQEAEREKREVDDEERKIREAEEEAERQATESRRKKREEERKRYANFMN